jgi:hypothetical protein
MTPNPFVQRNPYKGTNPRCWVRIRFAAALRSPCVQQAACTSRDAQNLARFLGGLLQLERDREAGQPHSLPEDDGAMGDLGEFHGGRDAVLGQEIESRN